jgi:hypothetical protein
MECLYSDAVEDLDSSSAGLYGERKERHKTLGPRCLSNLLGIAQVSDV